MFSRKFIFCLIFILISFSYSSSFATINTPLESNTPSESVSMKKTQNQLRFGFLVNSLEDYQQSYIDQVYDAAAMLSTDYNITIIGPRAQWTSNFNNSFYAMAKNGTYDIIFVIGRMAGDDLIYSTNFQNFRDHYPNQRVVAIDTTNRYQSWNLGRNMTFIDFAQEEGSFLAGMLMALTTDEDHFGMIINYSKFMRRGIYSYEESYLSGWISGIRYIKPNAQIDIKSLRRGNLGDDGVWDPEEDNFDVRGAEAINYLAERGVKTVCVSGGNASSTIYSIAEQKDIKLVALESNENVFDPVKVSVAKNITNVIFDVVSWYNSSKLDQIMNTGQLSIQYGLNPYDLTVRLDEAQLSLTVHKGINVVDYEAYVNNTDLTESQKTEIIQKIENITARIGAGTLDVPITLETPSASGFTVANLIFIIPIFLVIIHFKKKKK